MLLLLWVSTATMVYARINRDDSLMPNAELRYRDANDDILDEQAANEIFGSERGGLTSEQQHPPSTNVVPYDINVDPNYPVHAPRARALAGEFSTNQVDEQFRTGYRWGSSPARTLTRYQGFRTDQTLRRSPTYSVQQPYGYASYAGSQSPYGITQV
ncbi:hypothetical protein OSTOST_26071, partial [Ostertagia ostertagi]